jgi:integrative and conjugative element protein (TIGR02256 family)
MHLQDVTVWIPSRILQTLHSEANRLFPDETGGVLIGYWADDINVVVTAGVGPGPAAIHGRYSYEHDHVWEAAQIALDYERSGRSHVYIGDWHTHPEAVSGRLSRTDRRSLRSVLGSREARLSRALMVVLFGRPSGWEADCWLAEFEPASIWRWRRSLSIKAARLRCFD